jgi:ubiquinone/menaquinone biosynthesis C-methylase UbiE
MNLNDLLHLLRCPLTGDPLKTAGDSLTNISGSHRYRLSTGGIPMFAEQICSADARKQQEHYDQVCDSYLTNLTYPHTQEYFAYLDRALFRQIGADNLGVTVEVCCGRGEALRLLADRIEVGIGVDVSLNMLEVGARQLTGQNSVLVQGDATLLPLRDGVADTVITLGGIHHVNDRQKMFGEIYRVLKPGGRFIWREPANDFLLWRALRAVIYRLSPALDSETEKPLRYRDTVPPLEQAGLELTSWRTYGAAGFCLFMNSDVLVFNRLFRLLPGIRMITRLFAGLDHLITSTWPFRRLGLQVIGVARKPVAGGPAQRIAA